MSKQTLASENGNTLLIVVLLMLALSAVGTALLSIASVEVDIAGNQRSGEVALFNADAGLRTALYQAFQQSNAGGPQLTAQLEPILGGEQQLYFDGTGGSRPAPGASFEAEAELDHNRQGCAYECQDAGQNIAVGGSSQTFGRRRFHVVSTGYTYPPGVAVGDPARAYASRTVEAVLLSNPVTGVCPCGQGASY